MKSQHQALPRGVRLLSTNTGKWYWLVKVTRVTGCFQKRFRCDLYDGEEPALKAALQWLEEINQTHPPKTPLEKVRILHTRNTSGRTGVCRCSTVKRRNGKTTVFWYWRALDPDNHRKSKSFLISRYGEEQAYCLAVNARTAFEAEYDRRQK